MGYPVLPTNKQTHLNIFSDRAIVEVQEKNCFSNMMCPYSKLIYLSVNNVWVFTNVRILVAQTRKFKT